MKGAIVGLLALVLGSFLSAGEVLADGPVDIYPELRDGSVYTVGRWRDGTYTVATQEYPEGRSDGSEVYIWMWDDGRVSVLVREYTETDASGGTWVVREWGDGSYSMRQVGSPVAPAEPPPAAAPAPAPPAAGLSVAPGRYRVYRGVDVQLDAMTSANFTVGDVVVAPDGSITVNVGIRSGTIPGYVGEIIVPPQTPGWAGLFDSRGRLILNTGVTGKLVEGGKLPPDKRTQMEGAFLFPPPPPGEYVFTFGWGGGGIGDINLSGR